jgi:ribosomal protein L30E
LKKQLSLLQILTWVNYSIIKKLIKHTQKKNLGEESTQKRSKKNKPKLILVTVKFVVSISQNMDFGASGANN